MQLQDPFAPATASSPRIPFKKVKNLAQSVTGDPIFASTWESYLSAPLAGIFFPCVTFKVIPFIRSTWKVPDDSRNSKVDRKLHKIAFFCKPANFPRFFPIPPPLRQSTKCLAMNSRFSFTLFRFVRWCSAGSCFNTFRAFLAPHSAGGTDGWCN